MASVLVALRIGLGGVFVIAGVAKIRQPRAARRLLAELLPIHELRRAQVLVVVCVLEILLGGWLIVGLSAIAALWVSIGLLIGFILLLAETQRRGVSASCGCFGRAGGAWGSTMLRNSLLLAAALCSVLWPGAGRGHLLLWEAGWDVAISLVLLAVLGGLLQLWTRTWQLLRL